MKLEFREVTAADSAFTAQMTSDVRELAKRRELSSPLTTHLEDRRLAYEDVVSCYLCQLAEKITELEAEIKELKK